MHINANDVPIEKLPTARTAIKHCIISAICSKCGYSKDLDLQKLIDIGKCDTPLIHLKLTCSRCGNKKCDSVASGRWLRESEAG